ncbi:UL36 very large tegument protein [Streptomyces sp. NPDC046371]|uniref:UL36 very large tegument protein n=1 Tax=Streptomyces sp. NPDC046371 TaxID=3154916 RepID=UPI0033FCCEF0
MTVYQLPVELAAFAGWLSELAGRLRPGEGWYGVFAARDPEGLRACFDGTELPPWDVVASLLQDLGEPPGAPRAARGRALYEAAAAAHDRAPDAARSLAARHRRAHEAAAEAETRLQHLAATPGPALAWARDDLYRARARAAELGARRARMAEAAGAGAGGSVAAGADTSVAPASGADASVAPASGAASASGSTLAPGAAPASASTRDPAAAPDSPPAAAPSPSAPKRRPRGARYAWLDGDGDGDGDGDDAAVDGPVRSAVPELPAGGAAPRGARFGGATAAAPVPAPAPVVDPGQAARAAGNAVYALRRLRAQGRGGDAHGLLCEALAGPPAWLPVLAAELHRAGLDADWATLLWEAASLPPARLAAVAGALADAGRPHDRDQLLRQGVARPVAELADACAVLSAEGHEPEARALLTAFVRARTPEDAARLAALDPAALTPRLLSAARDVSPSRARDLLHALRVAGLA